MMSKFLEAKEKVLQIVKQASDEKLIAGTCGNVSVYDREADAMIITPSSISYKTMSVDDIDVITLNGDMIEGMHKPSSEWRMHAEIYKGCPEVSAVVHTHSPYATSFSVSNQTVPFVLIEMFNSIGGDIPVAKFAIPGTKEVGLEAVKCLKSRHACLIQNHGVVAVGENLDQAYMRAVYVEDAARIYHYAKINGNAKAIGDDYVKVMMERKAAAEVN